MKRKTIADRLDEFVDRQGIVSAEFLNLIDKVESLEKQNEILVKALRLIYATSVESDWSRFVGFVGDIADKALEEIKEMK